MREETQPVTICVFCKLPLTKEQPPPVRLQNGGEAHAHCWDEYEDMERRRL